MKVGDEPEVVIEGIHHMAATHGKDCEKSVRQRHGNALFTKTMAHAASVSPGFPRYFFVVEPGERAIQRIEFRSIRGSLEKLANNHAGSHGHIRPDNPRNFRSLRRIAMP